jgi:hypothetical protein
MDVVNDLDVAGDVAKARRRNRAAEPHGRRTASPERAAIQLAATKNTVNTISPPVAPED